MQRNRQEGNVLFSVLFYFIAFLISISIIPAVTLSSVIIIVSSVLVFFVVIIKYLDTIFLLDIPYMEYIGITGEIDVNPTIELVISIIACVLLYIVGQLLWKGLFLCIEFMGIMKKKMTGR